jgi:hypothetical protein
MRAAVGRAELDPAVVFALGATVALSATSLSLTGLLGRLTTGSIIACLLMSLAGGVLVPRVLGARPLSGLGWTWVPLLALLLPSAAAALLLPPFTWDEVAYGAALPRDFAHARHFFYNADYGPYAAFPANYEALVTAGLMLSGDVWPTQLLNVVLALAMAAMAMRLALALGASKPAAYVAGLLVVCAPALILTAPVTKNDVACAFFQALAILALAIPLERAGTWTLVLSGAFVGVSLGVKYSSLHFALALMPVATVVIARSASTRGDALRRVLLWLAACVVFGSPWYVRNLLLFSNPLFPFLNDWLHASNGFTPEHSALLKECFDGLAEYSFKTGTTAIFVTRVAGGFGGLPTALFLPGVWLALRHPRSPVGLLTGGTAVLYLLLTFFAGYWQARYVLSLLVLACAMAVLVLERLGRATEKLGLARIRPTRLLLVAAAALAAWQAYPSLQRELQDVRAVRQVGPQRFAEERAPYYAVADWLNTHLSERDRVAIGFNVQPFYYLKRSYYHIHPLTQGDLQFAETPGEVEASLRRVGATYLAFSGSDGTYYEATAPKITAYRERLWMAQRRLRQAGRLRLVATVQGVRILRLEDGSERTSESR